MRIQILHFAVRMYNSAKIQLEGNCDCRLPFQKVFSDITLPFKRSTLTGPLLSVGLLLKNLCFQVYSERTLSSRRSTLTQPVVSEGQRGLFVSEMVWLSEGLLWKDPFFQLVYSERTFEKKTSFQTVYSDIVRVFRGGSSLKGPLLSFGLLWKDLCFQVYSEKTLPFRRSSLKRVLLSGLLWKNPSFQKVYSEKILALLKSTLKGHFFSDGLLGNNPYFKVYSNSNRTRLFKGPLWQSTSF